MVEGLGLAVQTPRPIIRVHDEANFPSIGVIGLTKNIDSKFMSRDLELEVKV